MDIWSPMVRGLAPSTTSLRRQSPVLNNKTFPVVVGCVVGGSSAVNGMVFQRGNAKYYDIWAELSGRNPRGSWNWPDMLKYFKKAIQFTAPKPETAAFDLRYDTQYWGRNFTTNHTIFATFGNVISPKTHPFYEAAKKVPGVNISPDAGSGQTGLQYYQTSTNPYTGERSYARSGHWDGLNRDNYHLLTATRVNKIVFDRERAAGVQIYPRGERDRKSVIRARKEAIVAAGAIHTPQILQLSGIGPAGLLKRAGIPVKVDLPGVGYNFQDHTFIPAVSFRWSTSPSIPAHLNTSVLDDRLGRTSLGLSIGLPVVSPSSFGQIASDYQSQSPAAYLPKRTHPTIIRGYRKQQQIPSVYHPVGAAAKMPRELGGVVGDDLLVYEARGLSVVDACIMPTIVAATTSMTVYAVAEKAADLIKMRA